MDKYNYEEVFVVPFNETLYIDNGYTNESDKGIWSKFDAVGKYILRTDAEKNKWNNASNYKSETFEPVTKKGIGIDSTGFNNLEGIFAVENKTN